MSGVTDPDEISRIIREHAEDMSRPPPKPAEGDPIPGAKDVYTSSSHKGIVMDVI